MGYDKYDVQPEEVKRTITELRDYHERITNLQYVPSEEEINYLMKFLPVEVGGDPSERIEVSNHKNLPRIPTDQIRSGFCLVLSSCIPLKAPKLWKQLSKWGKDFNLEWDFLEEFLKIQKKAKAGSKGAQQDKLSPDYTYIKDLVAGRPILGFPLRVGGFRLRYGRSRTSGFSAMSIHPATMYILNQYIATGTQLKTERPGKAASMTACDTIEGPIVKLEDGTVLKVSSLEQAKQVISKVKAILYLGDILISYGDFFNRAHPLIPAGYCEEWWVQELQKSPQKDSVARLDEFVADPLRNIPSAQEAIAIAKSTSTPLHPAHTWLWTVLDIEQFKQLLQWFDQAKVHTSEKGIQKIVLPITDAKEQLDRLGVPHVVVNNEFVVIEGEEAIILSALLGLMDDKPSELKLAGTVLESLNSFSPVTIRDKAGTFIGSRMGRPEKAKQRLLTGSPHVLFPVGEEGGRLRSFQSALKTGKVTADFAMYRCEKCKTETVLHACEVCGTKTQQQWTCAVCGLLPKPECELHGENRASSKQSIPIKHYFDAVLKQLGIRHYPELIKGVRGTSNKDHIPEHLAKGVLRARYGIHVYKDGTTRYDMTQLPLTHFKPMEIGTSVEQLRDLGYIKDIKGVKLTDPEQILELKPQDIVLPSCDESPEDGADKVLINVSKFIDDMFEQLYGLPRYYNFSKAIDLVGQLTIVLAPHTSAGVVGRIIGFSKTQSLLAHPLLHALTRRDCDGDEACVLLLLDGFLNFSRKYLSKNRGSTMDTPLVLTSVITPTEVDDMVFDLDIEWQYPIELYEAGLEYKYPWDVKVNQVKAHLDTPSQYENMGFTHDTSDLNATVRCSAYKTLPSMEEKLKGQMDLAEKLRSVEASDVAQMVIEKHFLKDTKGNLRKFSMQQFRCVHCNEKFRRPPLIGKCTKCQGKIIFTISQGSVIKYLEPSISLANKYNVPQYLKETLELLQVRVDGVFGKDPEKQTGLGEWFT